MFLKKNKNWLESYASNLPTPKRNFRPWLLVIVAVIVLLGWLFIPLFFNGTIIALRANDIYSRIRVVEESVGKLDLIKVNEESKMIVSDLREIKYRLERLGPLTKVPPLKRIDGVLIKFTSASAELLEGYNEVLLVFTELEIDGSEESLLLHLAQSGNKKFILELIANNSEKLIRAENKIEQAKKELEDISIGELSGLLGRELLLVNNLLSDVTDKSSAILPLLRHLPEIAGLGEERNYLLLFKNNMEMRPTGGFIGSYGLLKIKDGMIISLETDDIYNLDKQSIGKLQVDPPWPMKTYFNRQSLFLRDANWSPDWPTSAKQIEWFWDVERVNAGLLPIELDGIIALNPDFIANILELTGEVEIDGIKFNHKNFALELEMAVEFDYVDRGIPEEQRKNIIGDLSKILLDRVFDLSVFELADFLSIMKRNANEKNILVWFKNLQVQNYVSSRNWAGEIRESDGDFLYVVDANLGALKTDQVMRKSIDYSLSVDESGQLIARAEITYNHLGEKVTALISNYRTFTRVYTPDKSWLIRAYIKEGDQITEYSIPDQVAIDTENNKRSFGLFFTVNIKTSKTLVLEYRLPEAVKEKYLSGVYKLIVQKQPGTIGHPLKIDLKFDQPIRDYYSGVHASGKDTKSLWFDHSLITDYELKVNFK
jgi:hypothetical protein